MNENKIIDYILGLFAKNETSKDDIHWTINEKFDYDNEPLLILNRLIREGLILEMGEAYYSLTSEGRKAKKGIREICKESKILAIHRQGQQGFYPCKVPLWRRRLHCRMAGQGLSKCSWHVAGLPAGIGIP